MKIETIVEQHPNRKFELTKSYSETKKQEIRALKDLQSGRISFQSPLPLSSFPSPSLFVVVYYKTSLLKKKKKETKFDSTNKLFHWRKVPIRRN